jgi:hypothetical protein
MKEEAPDQVSFETQHSVRAPRILYRYNPINDYLRTTILEKTLWCTDPLTFNDPFDCDLPILFDDSPEDVIAATQKLLSSGRLSEFEKNQALASAQGGKYHNAEALPDAVRKTMQMSGIVCFSRVPSHILMWSHYADKHQGVCLGFDARLSGWMLGAERVVYSDSVQFPPVKFADLCKDEDREFAALNTLISTKSRHWVYEREWRFLHAGPFQSSSDPSRALTFPPEALRRVIFGCKANPTRMREIKLLFRDWPTKIHFFQAKRHATKFRVSIHLMEL